MKAPRKILKQIHSFSFEFVKCVSTGEGRPSLLVKDSDNSDTSLGFLKNSTAKIGRITTSLLFNMGFLESVSWDFASKNNSRISDEFECQTQ